jgi:hypothetical protein
MSCGPLLVSKEDILMRKEDILILKLYGGLGIVAVMGTYYKKECHNNPKTFAKV